VKVAKSNANYIIRGMSIFTCDKFALKKKDFTEKKRR